MPIPACAVWAVTHASHRSIQRSFDTSKNGLVPANTLASRTMVQISARLVTSPVRGPVTCLLPGQGPFDMTLTFRFRMLRGNLRHILVSYFR